MKGLCINASDLTVLEAGQEYFIFPGGSNPFYVSKFNNEKAHTGAFQKRRFEIIGTEEQPKSQPAEDQETFDNYSQMDLFEFLEQEPGDQSSGFEITIPEDVISPLECKNSPKSKAFKKVQYSWSNHVRAIQDYHNCSWFKAREKLMEHKKSVSPIQVARDPDSEI